MFLIPQVSVNLELVPLQKFLTNLVFHL